MTTFGLHLTDFSAPGFADDRLLDSVVDIAAALERSPAFTTLWLTDHMQNLGPVGPSAPMPEAYSLLAAIAARTSRLQLGVLATSALYRPAALLAKVVTTLDALSGGRVVLGIGAGHPRTEGEHRAFGYDFPSVGRRMDLLEDALATLLPMITPVSRPGTPVCNPGPRRAGGVPILVAGSGEQRLLRIAARYADLVNLSFPSGDSLDRIAHKRDVLATHCRTVGRDPNDIAVTYKAVMAVAETSARANADWNTWREARRIPEVDSRAGVFVGSPDEITAQFEPWLRAGIDHFVVELPHTDPESMTLASDTLAALGTLVGAR